MLYNLLTEHPDATNKLNYLLQFSNIGSLLGVLEM